jgi:hypothetical protein
MDVIIYGVGLALFGFRFYGVFCGPKFPRGRKPPSGGTRVKRSTTQAKGGRSGDFAFA